MRLTVIGNMNLEFYGDSNKTTMYVKAQAQGKTDELMDNDIAS